MTAGRGPLPWTGTAARTREIGYGDAMREIAQLVRDLLAQVPEGLPELPELPGAECPDAAERLAMRCALALSRVGTYAEAAGLLTLDPGLTIGNTWALGRGFDQTFTAMFGGDR